MIIMNNFITDKENLKFIYSGLGSISKRGREYLKKIAKSLIAIQNRPGTPVPDKIGQEIEENSRKEYLP